MSYRPASPRPAAQPVCGKCGGTLPAVAPLSPSELRALTRQPVPVIESTIPAAPSLTDRVLALRRQSATAPAGSVARGGNQSVPPAPPSLVDKVMALRRQAAGAR